jgi:molybdopterin molybdotransferase
MMASKPPLLPVSEALARILASAGEVMPAETVPLAEAHRRTLAQDLIAPRDQPPFPASAMDGYAIRAADVTRVPAKLRLIGMSAAGHAFEGSHRSGEAVRIFTGAPVPLGADTIIVQEDTEASDGFVTVKEGAPVGRHIRPAGLDFAAGEILLESGHRVTARDLALIAAAGFVNLAVRRKPGVAILATGDELAQPGSALKPGQIVASNTFAVAGMVRAFGADPIDLGIARDDLSETRKAIQGALTRKAEIMTTLGGASVGDHDLVQQALAEEGMRLGFWRIAMRPGKPLMHGLLHGMRILGFPGNPVSSMVCAIIFLRPLIRAKLGDPEAGADPARAAVLGADMQANDERQDYVRATIEPDTSPPVVTPFPRQDSSMMGVFARANALILREVRAPAAKAGDPCRAIILNEWE